MPLLVPVITGVAEVAEAVTLFMAVTADKAEAEAEALEEEALV